LTFAPDAPAFARDGGKMMINLVVRGLLVLWAAVFGLMAVQELFSAAPYFDMFGVTGDAKAINAVRADFSAFFLVSAGGALLGAFRSDWRRALLVPAALFGSAFVGRAIGVTLGDVMTPEIRQAMVAEALSVVLLLGALWQLSRPAATSGPSADQS
jgi:hypothetical protein